MVALLRGHEVGQRAAGGHLRTLALVAQEVETADPLGLGFVTVDLNVIADATGGPEAGGATEMEAVAADQVVKLDTRLVEELARFVAILA